MHWSEQGRETRRRTVVASDEKGDAFVAICVHALVGSSVPTVNTLVWREGLVRVTAGPLQGCSVGGGHRIRTVGGWVSPVWAAQWTGREPPPSHNSFCFL